MKKLNNSGLAHLGMTLVLLGVVSVVVFAGYSVFKKQGSGKNEDSDKSQNKISCAPEDEHQWYRTDSTFVVNPKDPDTMYVNVEYKGFYKSTDGGKSWIKKVNGIFTENIDEKTGKDCFGEYPAAIIDPEDPERLLLAGSGSPGTLKDLNAKGGGIYETTDGGENWKQKIKTDMNAYATHALTFKPGDSQVYYYGSSAAPASYLEADQDKIFVTKGIVYRTKDNGKNWDELPTGFIKNTRAIQVMVDPNNTDKISVATNVMIRQNNGPNTIANEQMGLLQTTDGGKTWKRADDLPSGYQAAMDVTSSPTNGDNIFFIPAVSENAQLKSFYSTNGGQNFKQADRSLDLVVYDSNDKSGNTLIGYIWQSQNGPVNSLFKSTDAGKTWKAFGVLPKEIKNVMDQKTRIQNIVLHPKDKNSFFMTGAGGLVWKTTDNGESWTKLLSYDAL